MEKENVSKRIPEPKYSMNDKNKKTNLGKKDFL